MTIAQKNVVNFLLVLGGKVSVTGVIFIGGILVARFSGAAEYGVFCVAMSAVLICDGMIGAPLDMAAVRFSALHEGEVARSNRFQAMALHLKLILAGLVFLAVLLLLPWIREWRTDRVTGPFPIVSCFFAVTCLLMARSVGTGLQIRTHFRQYSLVDVAQGALRMVGFALLTACHFARAGLFLLVYGIAALATALSGVTWFGQKYLLGRWPDRPDVSRMLSYCGYTAGIIALGTVTGRGDLIVLAILYGAGKTSAYALASQMAMLLAQLALYASVLTQPQVLPLARQGKLRRLFLVNFVIVGFVAIAAIGVLSPRFLDFVTQLVFGRGFDESVPLLQILCLGALIDLLVVPVLMVFCIQACPAKAFWGEIVITCGFLVAATGVVTGYFTGPAAQVMAWVAVSARLAKLVLYGGLFAIYTRSSSVAGPGMPGDESVPGGQANRLSGVTGIVRDMLANRRGIWKNEGLQSPK
jgi:O-antigen/teichoic acid export membrane protein